MIIDKHYIPVYASKSKPKKMTENNFYHHPFKTQLVLVMSAFIIENIMLVFAMTNFFTEGIFQSKYFVLYFLMLGSLINTAKVCLNYYKKSN